MKIHDSELILNPDGSIYHLNLLPEDIADTIITVGDPDRVPVVSKYFDRIEIKKQKREITTHTGYIGKKRITVISTGMGTGSIDIVLNELDALANIDFKQRTVKSKTTQLDIIRVGTSGSLHSFIPVDSVVISKYAIGLDSLGNFYQFQNNPAETQIRTAFVAHFNQHPSFTSSYIAEGSDALVNQLHDKNTLQGITVTCGGFYGAQGRILRAQPLIPDLIKQLQLFESNGQTITNFEMETAGIYVMGKLLNHRCCSISAIVANRATLQFSADPAIAVENLIKHALEKIAAP